MSPGGQKSPPKKPPTFSKLNDGTVARGRGVKSAQPTFVTTTAAAAGGRLDSRGIPFPAPPVATAGAGRDTSTVLPAFLHQSATGLLATTKQRYDLRHGVAVLLRPEKGGRGPAVCGCGTPGGLRGDPKSADRDVHVHLTAKHRAYVSGVYRCDSAWLCPVCVARRASEIQARIENAAFAGINHGGSMWMVTVTASHSLHTTLSDLKDAVQKAFHAARAGRAYIALQEDHGLQGLTVAPEAPWSPTAGWHYHQHVLIFFNHQNSERAEAACRQLVAKYLKKLRSRGFRGSRCGQHFEECDSALKAAKYVAKMAAELAHGWIKTSQKGDSVHAFALAARATGADDQPVAGLENVSREQARALFREYAAVMPGTRIGVISPTLAGRLGIEAAADEERQQIQQLLEFERIGEIPNSLFSRLHRQNLIGTMLSKVEQTCRPDGTGWASVRAWIDEVGAFDEAEGPPSEDDGATTAEHRRHEERSPLNEIVLRVRREVNAAQVIARGLHQMTRDHARFPGAPPPPSARDLALAILAPAGATNNLALRGWLEKIRRQSVTRELVSPMPTASTG